MGFAIFLLVGGTKWRQKKMKVLYEWKNHEIAGYSAVSMSEDYGYIDSMISGRKRVDL